MLPILLLSEKAESVEKYVNELVISFGIPSHSIIRVRPENTVIGIEQVRDIRSLAQGHEPRIIVLYDFESARIETQNALLKTLEETPENTHFILVVRDELSVLSTIRSRTQVVSLRDSQNRKLELLHKHGFLDPSMNVDVWLATTASVPKEAAQEIIEELGIYLRECNRKKPLNTNAYTTVQTELMRLGSLVSRNNVNYEYTLDAVGRLLNQYGLLPLPR
jgi:DNA polymerase III delta prime subunit